MEQVQLLRAAGNITEIMNVTRSGIASPTTTTHSKADVWVNALFFTSLALTMATALLSVLIKQWLQVCSRFGTVLLSAEFQTGLHVADIGKR